MNTAILHELAHNQPTTGTGRHRLTAGPLNRAIRACLEVTDCAVTLQEIIGDATARARRDRELRVLLDAAAFTAADITTEADEIGQALIQLELVAKARA
jgi:hypothetical protein